MLATFVTTTSARVVDPRADSSAPAPAAPPPARAPLGPQPIGRNGRVAQPLTLAPPLRHAQSFLAPQPLRALAVQPPALIEQHLMRAAVPPPRPPAGDPPQLRAQRRVLGSD